MQIVDGEIRKIKSMLGSKVFFDFEFWGESDTDTDGLICLVQVNDPKQLFITKMTKDELTLHTIAHGLEIVKNRVEKETGVKDLVYLKVIRFDRKKSTIDAGFQEFLKSYEKPIPVYEDIFNHNEEAFQVAKISIEEFKNIGGKIKFLNVVSRPTVPNNFLP